MSLWIRGSQGLGKPFCAISLSFWFISIINLCRQFFAISERKILDPNGWTVNLSAETAYPVDATTANITAALLHEFTDVHTAIKPVMSTMLPAESKFAFPAACTKPTIAESAILTSDFPGAVSCYPDVDQISGR